MCKGCHWQILHCGFVQKRCGWGINPSRAKLNLVLTICSSMCDKDTQTQQGEVFRTEKMTSRPRGTGASKLLAQITVFS